MQMTLVSITVWFTHFLIASALYFDTEPTNTLDDYTQTTQITPATTTTNTEPESLTKTTPSSPLTTNLPTEVHTQPNTSPNVTSAMEKTFLHQHNSTPSESNTTDDGVITTNAADDAMSHTNSYSTVPTNFASLKPQKDTDNVTETVSSASFNDDGHTVQPNTTLNVTFGQETTSLHQHHSSVSPNHMVDDDVTISNASDITLSHTNTSNATVPTNFANLTLLKDENNETGTMSNVSYNDDGHTIQPENISDLFNSVSTVAWKDWSEKEDEMMNVDEENYKTNSTQTTFANTNEESRGTEGSYGFKSEHGEEHYDTIANTTHVSARNDWSTPQNTDISMITPAYTIPQDSTVTDEPEYHSPKSVTGQPTTQQHIYRFTNSVARIDRQTNTTGTDPPTAFTNNNSTITDVLTDNGTNTTTNKTDIKSKEWETCLDPESQSRKSRIVCFITLWTLAMTATIFLGISIFLCVRLSFWKKQMKRKEKAGHVSEKESLWADPKASVQERVEFWYVNGSTLEADRKEKDRRRKERMKRGARQQVVEETEMWIQPRVTMNDIADFWYANRRIKEEVTQDLQSNTSDSTENNLDSYTFMRPPEAERFLTETSFEQVNV